MTSFTSRSFRSNHRFVALMLSIAATAGLMLGLVVDASAAENHPSHARAKLAYDNAPMACVVRTEIRPDGSIHRISRCEAEQPGWHAYEADCHRQPLANGRKGETVRVCDRVRLVYIASK